MEEKRMHRLNERQRAAVTHTEGPILVVAGAGTGKTSVLVEKYAHLVLDKNINPDHILVLVFNDKAAQELDERLDTMLPLGYYNRWVHTYHGFCQRILETHAHDLDRNSDIVIYDSIAQWIALFNVIKLLKEKGAISHYAPVTNMSKYISDIRSHISRAKDELIDAKTYSKWVTYLKKELKNKKTEDAYATELREEDADEQKSAIKKHAEIARIYAAYQNTLESKNAFDFGDLVSETVRLFKTKKRIRNAYRKRFKYIFVDEFQDTNTAQYALLLELAPPESNPNITVVGDDDQSIYKFRGAAVQNILSFKKQYVNASIVPLTENYRSQQPILDTAHTLIQSNNPERLEGTMKDDAGKPIVKKLASKTDTDKPFGITAHWLLDHEREFTWIAGQIQAGVSETGYDYGDMAILCRNNETAERMEETLTRAGIPNRWLSSSGLYTTETALDIIAGLKLLAYFHDSNALFRVIHWPIPAFQLKPQTVMDIAHIARKRGISLWDALNEHTGPEIEKTRHIRDVFIRVYEQSSRKPVTKLFLDMMHQTEYAATILADANAENQRTKSMHLNLLYKRLNVFARQHPHPNVRNFLEEFELELAASGKGDLPFDPHAGPEHVTILTVHASKGLEWPVIFIPSVLEQKFPSRPRGEPLPIPDSLMVFAHTDDFQPSTDTHAAHHEREERRLMYVALTRGKHRVFVTGAEDYGGKQKRKRSRFLDEMNIPVSEESCPIDDSHRFFPDTKKPYTQTTHVKKQFSFTQLQDYNQCPYRYYIKYILGLPTAGNYNMSFGQTIHKTIEIFFMREKQTGKTPKKNELLDIYERSWISEWYPSKTFEAERKKDGLKMLSDFYARYKKEPDKTVEVEKSFTVHIGTNTLKGKIDRIASLPDGTWVIYDFKTSKPKSRSSISSAGMHEQLYVYTIAVRRGMDANVTATYLYFLDGGGALEAYTATESQLEAFEKKMLETMERIQVAEFDPTPGPHTCAYCDYKDICSRRKL